MRVKLILIVMALFLLSSCNYEQTNDVQGKPLVFIVEEPQVKTFIGGGRSDLEWFDDTKLERNGLNTIRSLREDKEDLEEFEIKSKMSNVRRIIENDFGERELIIGYDKELDNPEFKEVDY